MRQRLSPTGRPLGLVAGIAAVHAAGLVLFVVDPRLPLLLLAVAATVAVALERPLWGVALVVAGRLTSTGANAWVRLGKVNIDLFEPALLLALAALITHAALHRRRVWRDAPWRTPVVAFLGFQVLALGWSADRVEGVQEIVATGVILATTLVILAFVRTWRDVRFVLLAWVVTSTLVALASVVGVLQSSETAFEMAQNSREGGFGQHPNWFAMNLVYIVPTAAGLGLVERRRWLRWALLGAAAFVFLAQMRSGSRGGTWSVLLGLGVAALFHPRIRRAVLVSGAAVAVVVVGVLLLDTGATAKAFERIWGAGGQLFGRSVRVANWSVSWQLLLDTWGLGIGPGGYDEHLARYDWWLYNSQYRYPHGIFWGLMAHYGVAGLALGAWFVARVGRMGRDLVARTRGSDLQVVAWAMTATLLGYTAWSFVEFSYDDKPFWEFLAVYTALWSAVRRRDGEEAP